MLDYSTICPNARCEKYGCIADYVPTNACQCNDACELYNDCCSGSYIPIIHVFTLNEPHEI